MVLESVGFGLAAALGWGVADFLAAMAARRVGLLKTVLGVHIVSVGVASLYLLVAADLPMITALQWGILAAIALVGLVSYLAFYRALMLGPVAVVSPIIGSYAVVVILLAVLFLGDRLSGLQSVAVVASVGGVVVASISPDGLSRGQFALGGGVLFAIGATLGVGVWQFANGVLSRELGWFVPIYVSRVFILAILVPVTATTRRWPWRGVSATVGLGIAVAAIVETAGLFAFTRGTEIGVIPIVAAASTTYPVVPILGGLLIFRERLSRTQWMGITVALAGLVLLAVSG